MRWWSLAAGFAGAFLGFWLCIGSSFLYNLIVGGKPVVSWLPFSVIGFELTILTSALTTLGAVLVYARLYPREPAETYDPGFSVDKFGIAVAVATGAEGDVVEMLERAGAEEIHVT